MKMFHPDPDTEKVSFPYQGVCAYWEVTDRLIVPESTNMTKPVGMCGEYIRIAEHCTDAPWPYHEIAFWTIAGTAFGRSVFTLRGPHRVYPNIYAVLLGESTTTHKTTSIDIADTLAKLLSVPMLPASVTPERLMEILVDRPRGVMVSPEFSKFLAIAHKHYGHGLIEMLLELYDCPPEYIVETKSGGRQCATEPFVSVLAASTPDTFKLGLTESDISGGLIPRFVMAAGVDLRRSPLQRQPKLERKKLADIAKRVSVFIRPMGEENEYNLTEGAERENESFSKMINRGFEGTFGSVSMPLCERLKTTAIKIGLISAILRGADRIGQIDIHAGIGVILRVLEGYEIVSPILEEVDRYGAQVKKIEASIRAQKSVAWSTLQRRDRLTIPAARFAAIIKTLVDSKLIEIEKHKTGGRDGAFLLWVGPASP